MEWLVGPVAGGLFDYNRENFFFDWEQRLKREFQGQNMRVKQFGLYRDDVRDLMGLTVSKMDNYLVVNSFTLGICVMLFTMGRPGTDGNAQWVLWLGSMTTASALFYTLMSMWLAMHASVAAHSFGVRMLTQLVRLPIPSKAQLDAATAVARDYESRNISDMMRIPVVAQQMQRLAAMDNCTQENPREVEPSMSDDEGSSVSDRESMRVQPAAAVSALKHVKVYRKLQANWQAYDAYARVSMAMGTNQLLHAVSLFTVRMLVTDQHSVWPALCCMTILVFAAWLLCNLDLYLTPRVLQMAGILQMLPRAVTTVGLVIHHSEYSKDYEIVSDLCAPFSFLMHMIWILFYRWIATPTVFNGVALPTNFRSVLYLDVFGYLKPSETDEAAGGREAAALTEDHGPRLSASLLEPPGAAEQPQVAQPVLRRQVSARTLAAQAMRNKLATVCRDMERVLSRDLDYWESSEISSMIEEFRIGQVRQLRSRFEGSSVARLDVEQAAGTTDEVLQDDEEPELPACWLQLEWWSSNMPLPFWYNCETKASVWTMPLAPNRISTLALLEGEIGAFSDKVAELQDYQPDVTSSVSVADALGDNSEREVEPSIAGAGPAVQGLADDDASEAEQFGGREAVPVEVFQREENTFHPDRRRRPNQQHRHRRHRLARGKLPWTTFSQGSFYMAGVWAIGLIWGIWRVWDHSIDIVTDQRLAMMSMGLPASSGGRLDIVFSGPWPHAYFQPRDLHCGGGGGGGGVRLLVLEEFGVHELRLAADEASPAGSRERSGAWSALDLVDACLAEEPDFLADGIRGVAELRTKPSPQGDVALLAASGLQVLRCRNASGLAAAAVVAVPGGPWSTVAATGDDALLAGKAEDASVVALRPTPAWEGHAGGWAPSFEILPPEAAVVQLRKAVVLGGNVLLRLGADGLLQAAPLRAARVGGGAAATWVKQLPGYARWDSVCFSDTEHSVFLLGHRHRGGRPLIARLSLPLELPA